MGGYRETHVSLVKTTGFPGGISGKESTCQCRRQERCRFNPWVWKIPGGGHGNPLQCSCLENPMDRGAVGLPSMGSQRVGHDRVHTQRCVVRYPLSLCPYQTTTKKQWHRPSEYHGWNSLLPGFQKPGNPSRLKLRMITKVMKHNSLKTLGTHKNTLGFHSQYGKESQEAC